MGHFKKFIKIDILMTNETLKLMKSKQDYGPIIQCIL
jgi:hypothetical protein